MASTAGLKPAREVTMGFDYNCGIGSNVVSAVLLDEVGVGVWTNRDLPDVCF